MSNHLRIAFRSLTRNKLHSFINIAGLSVGMAVTILIGLWIWDECSYEKYNENYDRVGRIMQIGTNDNEKYAYSAVPVPLIEELQTTYGRNFKYVVPSQWQRDHILSFENKKLIEKGKFMGPQATEVFALKMLRGTRAALNDPSSIILSASAAQAFFADADPIGKTMKIDNEMTVSVTGVYEDLPHNSLYNQCMFIAPWDLFVAHDKTIQDVRNIWAYDAIELFVELADHTDADKVSQQIRDVSLNKLKQANDPGVSYKPALFLQPMSRWHLYSEFKNGVNTGGRIQFVWLIATIGIFILLLACINFMNLSTARSEKRAKEVGIRKAIGSGRGQLINQFLRESLLAAVLAFAFSLIWVQLALPFFNTIADKKMVLPLTAPIFWLLGLGCCIITGLLAGSYPAFYLSSFQPVKVLKGSFRIGRLAALPRKALVIVQFTVSVTLIIGVIVVYRQIQFAKDRPAGYDRTGLLTLQMTTHDFVGKHATLRNNLLQTGVVSEAAVSSSPTTGVWLSLDNFEWRGKDPSTKGDFGAIDVSPEYGKTVGWKFKEGRDFSREYATDSLGLVLNEAAAKYMGFTSATGETIQWGGKNYRVLGVIRNMLMESPYDPIRPTIYYLGKEEDANFIFVKINPGAPVATAVKKIHDVFQDIVPSAPFDYKFVDDVYARKFTSELSIGQLAGCFAGLAILISCLGIFGMASFMAEQRIKEIGVRKVLGASVFQVWRLLSKDFIILVIIALLIATPIAGYMMHNWLQGYDYRTGIPWWIFVAAGGGALAITLLTISYQIIQAALANPVKSLRSE